jgi:hypothetical protein
MRIQTPPYAYVFTLVFGVLATNISINSSRLQSEFGIFIFFMYIFLGMIVSLLWPHDSWKWGLWLSIPIVSLIGWSVLFVGYISVNLQKDLPVLIAIVLSCCLGGLVGSRLRVLLQSIYFIDIDE